MEQNGKPGRNGFLGVGQTFRGAQNQRIRNIVMPPFTKVFATNVEATKECKELLVTT